ncbi:MAG: DNA mismatch repair protein MutS [Tannerella sp.]|nr:DNA mismatch repair protein MutS [Tannerella sp.]
MEELVFFYNNRIAGCTSERDRMKKKISQTGTLRLLVAIACAVTLWFCRNEGGAVIAGIAVGFAIPFVALMMFHTKLFARKARAEELIKLNTNELNGLSCDFSAFDGAPELADMQHDFSADLDLFGSQSMFQSINRTVTGMGKSRLAGWFTQPLTDRQSIEERQEAIREMATKPLFRQDFYVTGITQPDSGDPVEQLTSLAGQRTYFSDSRLWRILIWAVPVCWIIVLAGCIGTLFPLNVSGFMLVASLLIANWKSKCILSMHRKVERMEKVLLTYSNLMETTENESFKSIMLKNARQQLTGSETASQAVKRLSRIIGALDQRFSLAGLLLNLFYLRDMRQAMRLENWLQRNGSRFVQWFDALASTDALCSLGGFAFNHPDYTYPTITDTCFCMEGKALGHPLLHREQCIRNDLNIRQYPYFVIITGANMAGKSTWLRTVGINFWLACIGAPVCAASLTVSPARLMTSLRTTDSLMASESYFYAELKRLKKMIDCLNQGEQLFIILDEILKGTNSLDKQKGSLALMRQLIAKNACGLIATHDLALGVLEQEFPGQVRNFCFEADIIGDELTFSYRLREGLAQNMNAAFLMRKMGITM